ncbi:hypothetical protein HK44_020660 [Pseudomonas fluorescens HK44]|uniref:Uncharacterized protein n=1 Tax=Pseudomonas fluorescens HK44 TaxID=1042209 RepID=A0A010TF70_PSEFL|nr:hypothetical protein [Pseudomonas fluorescens]EXF95802.1 hypothetical protein HK44_020660 [Pseudomonas fluorescens HK44]
MTKVTVNHDAAAPVETPKKSRNATITDSTGRTIQLRELDPLQKGRLVMSVGGEIAANNVFMSGFAIPAAMVTHVDDDFFGMPANIKQIEAMISILGEEGMEAIGAYLLKKYEAQKKEQEQAALSAEQAAAKN